MKHHKAKADHHTRKAQHHVARAKHHESKARHHAKLHRHHAKMSHHHAHVAAHHARNGRHDLARHHRRLSAHHARAARHHKRRHKHHKRMAHRHRKLARHHRRKARMHHRLSNHHRRLRNFHVRLAAVAHRPSIFKTLRKRLRREQRQLRKAVRRRKLRQRKRRQRRRQRRKARCRRLHSHFRRCRSNRCRRHTQHRMRNCNVVLHWPHKEKKKKIIVKKSTCRHAQRFLKRLQMRRVSLLARSRRCSDESTQCVSRIMRRVLNLNLQIKARARRCHIKIRQKHQKKKPRRGRRVPPVSSAGWKQAITCDEMNHEFKKWIQYQSFRRTELHNEACHCHPLDTSCQHFTFSLILQTQRKISEGRTAFAAQVSACDECAPLKLKYRRWLRRMKRKQIRLHGALSRCRPSDVECFERRLKRLERLQMLINVRRKAALELHGDCSSRVMTQIREKLVVETLKPTTIYREVASETVPPGMFPSISRFAGSAALTSISLSGTVLAILLLVS